MLRYSYGSGVSYEFLVDGPAAEGDSGAPAWDPETHKAVGLVAGGKLSSGCWQLPIQALMCKRITITPLLPRAGEALPEGVFPKMGLEIVKEG